jgi:hypothetical protein
MKHLWKLLLLLGLLAICGCTQGGRGGRSSSGPDEEENLRPPDSPDFLILSVSGHDVPGLGHSCPDTYNCEYLLERGTLEAISDIPKGHGLVVEIWTHVDELYSWYEDHNGDGLADPDEFLAFGFLDLLSEIRWINDNWIADFDNPTRVIVVAHSHGGVWAHSALMLNLDFPVDILLDLDTNALCWEADLACAFVGDTWRYDIDEYVAENNPGWTFDVGNASDSWSIPGLADLQDIEDVVPSSVFLNVEVRSDGTGAFDNHRNYRLDGTRTEIITEFFVGETHGGVTEPESEALQWAVDIIENSYIW